MSQKTNKQKLIKFFLGNARGSKFSMSANESHDGRDFWDFSWHEIGYYDLPCMLDHVLQETKMRQVFFVAHSQGATSLLVLLSTRPEYNEKIIQGHLMAPAVFLGHTPHPFLRPLANEVESGLLDDYKYLDLATIWEYGGSFADYLCDDNQTSIYCTVVLWWIFGANKNGVEVDIVSEPLIHKNQKTELIISFSENSSKANRLRFTKNQRDATNAFRAAN